MTFCLQCGGPLAEGWVAAEGRSRLLCRSCGYIHYLNPKVVAATLPIIDGKVVLIRRGIEPALGAWSYPAGYVELGETVEEAARRETREETRLTVRLKRLVNVYSFSHSSVVVIVYLAEPIEGQPAAGDEALDVGLFAPAMIPWDHLAFPSTVAALRDWVALARARVDADESE